MREKERERAKLSGLFLEVGKIMLVGGVKGKFSKKMFSF